MTTINLTLPWPPTVNTMFPSGNRGRRFLSDRGKKYVVAVGYAFMQQVGRRHNTMTGRVGYRVRMMPPDRRVRDLSNCLKALEDSLTKCGVWLDDSQVDDGHFTRGPVVKGGRVEVEIWEITTETT